MSLVKAAGRVGALVVAAGGSAVAGYVWRHWLAERLAITVAPPTGGAIVVFGASVDETGPSRELRSRLDHALMLWQRGVAPVIVVSGGVDRGIDEAESMAAYLVQRTVPADCVVDGRPGGNTRASVSTMAALGLQPYIAVSSAYHAYRILSECRRQAVAAVASAPAVTPETSRWRGHTVRFLTDMVGSGWYAVPPALSTRIDVGRLRHQVPQVLAGTKIVPRGSSTVGVTTPGLYEPVPTN